jgi:hypothetical protein
VWALLVAGCTSVPTASLSDSAVRRDGALSEGGIAAPVDSGYVRPDALSLPPADLDVVLPYLGPEATVDLDASAALGRLDVVFSIDGTGSFGGEIAALQSELTHTLVPALQASVMDVAFAVARFEDAPFAPFGEPTDRMYDLFTGITTDATRVAGAVARLDMPLGDGADNPEAGIECLFQIAMGTGIVVHGQTLAAAWNGVAAPGGGTSPGVGFRSGSFRVVVHATDAPSHDSADYGSIVPGTHSRAETLAALSSSHIRVLGIAADVAARPDLEQFARSTGATVPAHNGTCATGISGAARPAPSDGVCPLVYDVLPTGMGLSFAIVNAIGSATDALTYAMVWGEAEDDRLGFVQSIEAVSAMPAMGSTAPTRTDAHPAGDGVLDTFVDVHSGTSLVLRAHLANRSIEPADYDQVFRVLIHVLGDGLELVTREVRITVPRGRLDGAAASDAAPAVDASTQSDAQTDAGFDGGNG